MLRLYFLQQWFDLSDPAVEEALHESVSMRRFMRVDLGHEPVPDETTVGRSQECRSAYIETDLLRRW
jgi:IS5 family transposase